MATFESVNEYLTCNLCGKYYDEATTIPECLHTFCKKCLQSAFEVQNQPIKVCPNASCSIKISRDVEKQPKYDRCLQDCVNQLIPRGYKDLDSNTKEALGDSSKSSSKLALLDQRIPDMVFYRKGSMYRQY